MLSLFVAATPWALHVNAYTVRVRGSGSGSGLGLGLPWVCLPTRWKVVALYDWISVVYWCLKRLPLVGGHWGREGQEAKVWESHCRDIHERFLC